jgi:hypothetical protein
MILLSFLQSLSFLSLSHHHLLSRPPNNIINSTLQGLIKLHVSPPRARQRGHVHQPAPGLRRPRQRQVFASGRQKCAESPDGRAHVPQAQHSHLPPEGTRTRRAGPRVADHVRVSLLCGPAAYAAIRRRGPILRHSSSISHPLSLTRALCFSQPTPSPTLSLSLRSKVADDKPVEATAAVQRRVGHAVQGQRLQGRGDDCVFSVGQTG